MSDANATQAAFRAAALATVALNVGAASSNVALTLPPDGGGLSGSAPIWSQFQIYNAGTLPAYVAFGGAAVVAVLPVAGGAVGDYPVAPGATVVVSVVGSVLRVAAIATGASGNIYVTPGAGL